MRLHFLGANRQVTGSRYLLEGVGKRILVDCGLFQERPFQQRNWAVPPFDPVALDAVLLTHAHLDHCGLLPRLVKAGYRGPVYVTAATRELAQLVLLDSAKLQAEDLALKRLRHGLEGRIAPHPYEPLYDEADARRAFALMRVVEYEHPLELGDGLTATYYDAGHILGSALLSVAGPGSDGPPRRLAFSGDLGLWDKPLVRDPALLDSADYVVMESTYGDQDHPHPRKPGESVADVLAEVINQTVARAGNIVIPTFAIERAQEIVYHLGNLLRAGRIPHLLVFMDSPMAVDATYVFARHTDDLDEDTRARLAAGRSPFEFPGLVLCRSTAQSKSINRVRGSCVIMAGSGMCTGGRIKHHLARNIERPESTVLFVGYQARGTLGREILEGEREVRILGQRYTVRAAVCKVPGMSAHADRSTLLRWAGHFAENGRRPPRQLFLTHGEEAVSEGLAQTIRQQWGWNVSVPAYGEVADLEL